MIYPDWLLAAGGGGTGTGVNQLVSGYDIVLVDNTLDIELDEPILIRIEDTEVTLWIS
jgi:hypothetical protein